MCGSIHSSKLFQEPFVQWRRPVQISQDASTLHARQRIESFSNESYFTRLGRISREIGFRMWWSLQRGSKVRWMIFVFKVTFSKFWIVTVVTEPWQSAWSPEEMLLIAMPSLKYMWIKPLKSSLALSILVFNLHFEECPLSLTLNNNRPLLWVQFFPFQHISPTFLCLTNPVKKKNKDCFVSKCKNMVMLDCSFKNVVRDLQTTFPPK